MNKLIKLSLVGIAVASAFAAQAQITVNGTLDSAYGNAISLQTIVTGFGNGQSELDGGYGKIIGGTLYLMFTGNLQNNFNHLNIFIGTGGSGQNALSGTGGGWDGITLPTGLNANQIFDVNGDGNNLYVDQYSYSGSWSHTYLGDNASAWGSGNNTLSGGTNTNNVLAAINDSNSPGQPGSAGSALASGYAASVTTGIEFGIPLAALGNPTGNINILAAINGGGNGYLSNQFLGGANVGTQNLGSFSANSPVNLGQYGVNYFTVAQSVPAPSGIFALAVGGLALLLKRRNA